MSKKSNPGERLVEFFNHLRFDNIDGVDRFYAERVSFRDPIKAFEDRDDLKAYFAKQFKNLVSLRFEAVQIVTEGHTSSVEWVMHLKHKMLNLGREIRLEGVSVVTEDAKSGRIVAHSDYFDVSAFAFKSLPGADLIQNFFSKK
jgi:limonene-1,2-epoxide hydrolase